VKTVKNFIGKLIERRKRHTGVSFSLLLLAILLLLGLALVIPNYFFQRERALPGRAAPFSNASRPTPVCTGLKAHTDAVTTPPVPRPGYLQSFIDPTFGTKITRITGDVGTTIPRIGGTWSDVAVHHYSKDAAWNADQSLLAISKHLDGPNPLYLDGATYRPLFSRSTPGEARWHPRDPDAQIYMSNDEIGVYNIRTQKKLMSHRLPGYTNLAFGPGEGNPSLDGKWVAPLATSPSGEQVTFAFNLKSKQKYPDIDLTGVTVDWVSISALGRYIVVNGVINGKPDSTQVYDLRGNQVGDQWTEYGRPSHYDLTTDQHGDEVAVGVSKSAPGNGRVIKRRLRDGEVTVLTSGGYASHTSARATLNPGWVLVTYNYVGDVWLPYRNELVAVKLDGTGALRLGHLQANVTDYEAESHGVLSPDGMRAVFASNWNASSGRPMNAYVVDFRDKCTRVPSTPPAGSS
jgi:hypothetical protein